MSEPVDIYHWRRFDERLTTSGQPTEEQLKAIRDLGISHIINLGMHDHEKALADEPTSVSALDMEYIHIPVEFSDPTEADFSAFCAVMNELKGKTIHVHCLANLRVTAFLYRYQRDVLKLDEADARAVMDTVWQPGGAWAKFIGDEASIELEHRPPS